jgi:rod shape-determining protein MreD
MPLGRQTASAAPVDSIAARMTPTVTTILAALLALQPVRLAGYAALPPSILLMAVYHWTIYRPDLLPVLALFAIGVAYDLLSGRPIGATPLLLLLLRAAVLRCRPWFINRSFLFVWSGFALFTVVAIAGSWALLSALAVQFVGLDGSVFGAALTISLFPVLSFLLGRVQRVMIGLG